MTTRDKRPISRLRPRLPLQDKCHLMFPGGGGRRGSCDYFLFLPLFSPPACHTRHFESQQNRNSSEEQKADFRVRHRFDSVANPRISSEPNQTEAQTAGPKRMQCCDTMLPFRRRSSAARPQVRAHARRRFGASLSSGQVFISLTMGRRRHGPSVLSHHECSDAGPQSHSASDAPPRPRPHSPPFLSDL